MFTKTQNWIALTSIQIGGAICLPILLIGFQLAKSVGLTCALLAIALGNALLFALSLVGASMSTASTRTTTENAEPYLGRHAKGLFAAVMALSMSLWFAIQTAMMAEDLVLGLPYGLNATLISGLIAALIVVCALSGIKSIERLSNMAVPLMVLTMLIAISQGTSTSTVQHEGFALCDISLVLAACIACVFDMPTFFRHAVNKKEALKASIATFLVGIPLVEALGVFLYQATGAGSLMEALYCFDNELWKLWIMLFVLLAGWTTNNANLYSAAMSIKTLLPKLSDKIAILSLGAIALIFSLFDILSHLEVSLNVMGVMVASTGGVVFTGFMLGANSYIPYNILSLALGVCVGLLGAITAVPILDALMVSSLATLLLNYKRSTVCQ